VIRLVLNGSNTYTDTKQYNSLLYARRWGIRLRIKRVFSSLIDPTRLLQESIYDHTSTIRPALSWRRSYLTSAVGDTLCRSLTQLTTGTHEPVTSQGHIDISGRRGALASVNGRKSIASAVPSAAGTLFQRCASNWYGFFQHARNSVL
jgi:hypothetical protein